MFFAIQLRCVKSFFRAIGMAVGVAVGMAVGVAVKVAGVWPGVATATPGQCFQLYHLNNVAMHHLAFCRIFPTVILRLKINL